MILTIDVENWYDGNLHRQQVTASDDRVVGQTLELLDLLDEHRATATFFILGEVAGAHPGLVREIAACGHEVGCHGRSHVMVDSLLPADFAADLSASRRLLQQLSGQAVEGFRAPTWSLARAPWAVEVVKWAGFRYDSSIFPAPVPIYGCPQAPPEPFWLPAGPAGPLVELPPMTARLLGQRVPCAGGIYWRVMPWWLTKRLVDRSPSQVAYLHPWELDTDMPLARGASLFARWALSAGRDGARAKWEQFLGGYECQSCSSWLDSKDLDELTVYTGFMTA